MVSGCVQKDGKKGFARLSCVIFIDLRARGLVCWERDRRRSIFRNFAAAVLCGQTALTAPNKHGNLAGDPVRRTFYLTNQSSFAAGIENVGR